MERRLVRKSTNKIWGGICAGLAEYIGADVTLVRLITLFGILATGVLPGLFIYIICIVIIPLDYQAGGEYTGGSDSASSNSGYDRSYNTDSSYKAAPANNRFLIGALLIACGAFLFARMFFSWLSWKYIFAGILILAGIYMLLNNRRGQR